MKTPPLPQSTQAVKLVDILVIETAHRPLNEAHARLYAMRLEAGRIFAPVVIRRTPNGERKFTLVSGLHRYFGHSFAGFDEITAQIVKADQAEAAEIAIEENLLRYELTALDRILAVADYRELFEERFGEVKQGGDRRSAAARSNGQVGHLKTDLLGNETGSEEADFYARVTDRLGISARQARRCCKIARSLNTELRHALVGSTGENNQALIDALSRRPAEQQIAIARAILEFKGDVESAVEAIDNRPRLSKQEKANSALLNGWQMATPETRASALRFMLRDVGEDIAEVIPDLVEGKITRTEALKRLGWD